MLLEEDYTNGLNRRTKMKNMPTEVQMNERYMKLRNNLISLVYLNIIAIDISWVCYLIFQ